MDSHEKGDYTEAVVIAELKRRCIPVMLPFSDNQRYDLVVETPSGEMLRLQVKTGWFTDGVVQFHSRSQHTNSQGNIYKHYDGEVDGFLVYSHELDTLYLIAAASFDRSITLRVDEPHQEHESINWAGDYEFDDRWPPNWSDFDRRLPGRSPAIPQIGRVLEEHEIPFAHVTGEPYDFVAVDPEGRRHTICAQSGTVVNGRLRFDADGGSDIDAYGVFSPETDTLYLVPDDTFDRSISLRVEEPRQADASINWAEDYEFEARWPP